MKKISLKNVANTLSRKQMKEITGGYSYCCIAYGSGSTPSWSCGYDVYNAQAYYNGGGRGYCCASC
jgi:natural product precursor